MDQTAFFLIFLSLGYSVEILDLFREEQVMFCGLIIYVSLSASRSTRQHENRTSPLLTLFFF